MRSLSHDSVFIDFMGSLLIQCAPEASMIARTVLVFLVALPVTVGFAQVRIVQTNPAGDNVHLIDPATNKVVAEIKGIEANHGVAAAPDGSRFYFSNEADHTLDAVDRSEERRVRKESETRGGGG